MINLSWLRAPEIESNDNLAKIVQMFLLQWLHILVVIPRTGRNTCIICNVSNVNFIAHKISNSRPIRIYKTSMSVFKSLHHVSCELLSNYFLFMNHVRNTKNNENCVILPKVKLEIARASSLFLLGSIDI